MKLHKIPAIKTMKARLKELKDAGINKNQLEVALWCPYCDFLWHPIKEWPRQCSCCKKHIRDGYHRVRLDGQVVVHFKGRKMLKDAFAD